MSDRRCFVAAIGASAGGLEALTAFFERAPEASGVAWIVIQHLSPAQKSHLAELLGRRTRMPVAFAEEGVPVEPDHVYLSPCGEHLRIAAGRLHRARPTPSGDSPLLLPIDAFCGSLAEDAGDRCAVAILSGTGSDGTRGLRDVKEAGGLVLVQDGSTAQFAGMPRSALGTGLADFALSPTEMPRRIAEFAAMGPRVSESTLLRESDLLGRVLDVLERESGLEFRHYKLQTVARRIERRIALNRVESLDLYLKLLERSPREADALAKELLIHVTRFFRDPPAWVALRDRVLPELLEGTDGLRGLRAWVCGCSTGEEAYSLALLLADAIAAHERPPAYKVFATDVDPGAVAVAAEGRYPLGIAADVPRDLLERYFQREDESYRIAAEVREHVIFAQHDVIQDPPFSRMDFISCRNLLIYLEPGIQQKLLSRMGLALRRDGVLFLGTSESLGDVSDSFRAIDTRHKLYASQGFGKGRLGDGLPISTPRTNAGGSERSRRGEVQLQKVQREIIETALPPVAVVTRSGELVHAFGNVGRYLRIPSGRPSLDVVKMADGELGSVLAAAIRQGFARESAPTGETSSIDRGRERLRVRSRRLGVADRPLLALIFEAPPPRDALDATGEPSGTTLEGERIQRLEHELHHTRENLQATIGALETANEELRASNEELVASNQELQSTNEELQSVNEELHTMNAEYQAKIRELTIAEDDFHHLMLATGTATVFLDHQLRVRRFTASPLQLIHLVDADVGRDITDLSWSVGGDEILESARAVLASGEPRHLELEAAGDRIYRISVTPYENSDLRLRGVVIAAFDTTDARIGSREAEELAAVLDELPTAVVLLDAEGRIRYANPRLGELLCAESRLLGRRFDEFFDAPAKDDEQLENALRGAGEWAGLLPLRLREGGAAWCSAFVRSVELRGSGRPVPLVVLQRLPADQPAR